MLFYSCHEFRENSTQFCQCSYICMHNSTKKLSKIKVQVYALVKWYRFIIWLFAHTWLIYPKIIERSILITIVTCVSGTGRLAGNVVMNGKVLVNGKKRRLDFGTSVSTSHPF